MSSDSQAAAANPAVDSLYKRLNRLPGTLILGAALIGAAFLTLIFLSPQAVMAQTEGCASADSTVVVAGFSPLEGVSQEEASQISSRLNALLEPEVARVLTITAPFTLSYLNPETVGSVTGVDDLERLSSVRALAEQYCALMVVYGTFQGVDGAVLVQTQFYVNPLEVPDAITISGEYDFGGLINATEGDEDLSHLANALAQTIIGISQYARIAYSFAVNHFENAGAVPGWTESAGMDVLDIFIGYAKIELAKTSVQNCDIPTALAYLNDAERAFIQAREHSPATSRPYSGLASVYYELALWNQSTDCANPLIDAERLEEALAMVLMAQSQPEQPLERAVADQDSLTEARILYHLWRSVDAYSEDQRAQFRIDLDSALQRIISSYDRGNNPAIAPLAIDSYTLRAVVAIDESDCPSAIGDLDSALAIPLFSPLRTLDALGYLGQCYETIQNLDAARTVYERAITLAQDSGDFLAFQHFMELHNALPPGE